MKIVQHYDYATTIKNMVKGLANFVHGKNMVKGLDNFVHGKNFYIIVNF